MMRIQPNKRYLLDTNLWVNAFIKGDKQCKQIIKSCMDDSIIVCPLNNLLEIIHLLTIFKDKDSKRFMKRNNFSLMI